MNEIHAVMRHRREFARAIANKHYEFTPAGILFPDQGVITGGVFDTIHRRGGTLIDRFADPNIIPEQGRNHFLDVVVHGAAQISPWSMALFSGNVTPGSTLTGQSFAGTCTEFTGYDETGRVTFDEGAAASGVTDNGANRAVFTINTVGTIYGGALLSASAKGANGASDICLAAARFSASRPVQVGDELSVKYTLTVTSA